MENSVNKKAFLINQFTVSKLENTTQLVQMLDKLK